ncbi:hypothetical protein [Rasiella sp. SM2506]|uniref:hypothetical protein n=1 Tax=Rasiella sp. SM2506 TaxID=3423914 RepID=UPI003D79F329
MELARVQQLLDAYFEGTSTLQEEATLRSYFSGNTVAPQFKEYQPFFAGISATQKEKSIRPLSLPVEEKIMSRWWIGMVASLVIAAGVFGFFNQEPSLTTEEKEAIAAFEQTREAFKMMSQNFNEGAEELVYIHNFKEAKNKILK